MNLAEAMAALAAAGTQQNRKVYARHGVAGAMFGVSFANLDALKKRIGRDQALADGLWASANHDARVLATKIADPAAMGSVKLEAWARDLDNYVVTDAFSGLVGRTPHATAKGRKWRRRRSEWIAAAGWNLAALAALADGGPSDGDAPADDDFAGLIDGIVRDVHGAKNRARHAMNNALIAIGMRNAALRQRALAAAKRIGAVTVDHGDTSCKTPDAAAYIERVWKRREAVKPARTRARR